MSTEAKATAYQWSLGGSVRPNEHTKKLKPCLRLHVAGPRHTVNFRLDKSHRGGSMLFAWLGVQIAMDRREVYASLRSAGISKFYTGETQEQSPPDTLPDSGDITVEMSKTWKYHFQPDGRVVRLRKFHHHFRSGNPSTPPSDSFINDFICQMFDP